MATMCIPITFISKQSSFLATLLAYKGMHSVIGLAHWHRQPTAVAHCNILKLLPRPTSAAPLNNTAMYTVSLLRTTSPPLWLCRCTATVWCLHDVVCNGNILNSLSNSTLWPANPGSWSALVAQFALE